MQSIGIIKENDFSCLKSENDIRTDLYVKGYTKLEDILTTGKPKQTLTKRQHKNHIQKHDVEYKQGLFVNYLVKKINSCRNKYWSCTVENRKLYIRFRLGSIHDYTVVSLTNQNTKQDLFREIKRQMNLIIEYAKEATNKTERIMENI